MLALGTDEVCVAKEVTVTTMVTYAVLDVEGSSGDGLEVAGVLNFRAAADGAVEGVLDPDPEPALGFPLHTCFMSLSVPSG